MHQSEWPREFLERREVYLRGNTVYVRDSRGYEQSLASDSSIDDAEWVDGAVVIYYRNGNRIRYYGPYSSQRENY